MTLPTYAARWLEYAAQGRAEGTIRRYRAALGALCKALGDVELADVTASALKAWQMERSKHVAPTTLVVDITAIQALFSTAHKDGAIPRNPAASLEKPPLPPPAEELGVSWAQAREAIEEYASDPERAALLLLLGTGLRIGELLHLRREDVAGAFVSVRAHDNWKPKTRSSTRRIPLNDISRKAVGALLGANENGRLCHLTARALRTALEQACEEAGIERLTPHACRHLFLTRCAELGMSAEVRRRLAGHSSLAMVLHYTHLDSETLTEAMENFS